VHGFDFGVDARAGGLIIAEVRAMNRRFVRSVRRAAPDRPGAR
jgi:hypothetical protein